MKTIAQELNITEFPFEIKDGKGNLIYIEFENGLWSRWENNEKGWLIYYEGSGGIWEKWEYDEEGLVIYFENSKGQIKDSRPKSEPTPNITLQQCLDRGFTFEKVNDPVYKEQHGKDYMLCYLKLSKRHMIDYCNATCRCMVYKVDSEGTILERKYLKDVDDLDFYIRFLASEKVLKKLSKLG